MLPLHSSCTSPYHPFHVHKLPETLSLCSPALQTPTMRPSPPEASQEAFYHTGFLPHSVPTTSSTCTPLTTLDTQRSYLPLNTFLDECTADRSTYPGLNHRPDTSKLATPSFSNALVPPRPIVTSQHVLLRKVFLLGDNQAHQLRLLQLPRYFQGLCNPVHPRH